jgi:hypothetical protein
MLTDTNGAEEAVDSIPSGSARAPFASIHSNSPLF